MLHHYSDPTKGYGVSSALWDKVLQSDFEDEKLKLDNDKLKKQSKGSPFISKGGVLLCALFSSFDLTYMNSSLFFRKRIVLLDLIDLHIQH